MSCSDARGIDEPPASLIVSGRIALGEAVDLSRFSTFSMVLVPARTPLEPDLCAQRDDLVSSAVRETLFPASFLIEHDGLIHAEDWKIAAWLTTGATSHGLEPGSIYGERTFVVPVATCSEPTCFGGRIDRVEFALSSSVAACAK